MQQAYKYAILYYLVFSLLLLVSSISLFEIKIGFSYSEVLKYYLGNEESFMMAKTAVGLLKIILPHIFGFALFVMVILHFVMFTKTDKRRVMPYLIRASFLSAFIELFSPFFILNGFEFFGYLKLLSFVVFEILLLYLFWILYSSILTK